VSNSPTVRVGYGRLGPVRGEVRVFDVLSCAPCMSGALGVLFVSQIIMYFTCVKYVSIVRHLTDIEH